MIFLKFFSLFFLCFFLFACESSKQESIPISSNNKKNDDEPSLHINGFILTESVSGIKQWELKAKSADIFEKKNIVFANEINMFFYGSDKIFSNLNAEKAEMNMETKNITAKNNVKVISKKNVMLESDKLEWNASKQIFETDSPVKVTNNRSILTGIGLQTSSNLENIKILQNVKVETSNKEAFKLFKE
ncbi:LPS export ABC transporter periplasmic protein LptC [Candidatus Poribacteria bacterium]|nr:LPS export ABC transporter periplasmic protein LptC [Candidatus Poribacteria bacterium]